MSPAYTRIAKIKANQVRVQLPHCCNSKQYIEPIDILTWFEVIGYRALLHDDIQRSSSNQVVLWDYLESALTQINPDVPKIAIEAAISKVAYTSPEIIANLRFHQLLLNGVDVEYELDGQIINQKVRLIDTCNLLKNDWLVIDKFTVCGSNYMYNLDAVIFINGLPLAIILRADSESQKTRLNSAYLRLQSYQQLLPELFFYNVFLVIICKNQAKVGTLTNSLRDFVPWYMDGEDWIYGESPIETLIQGLFEKRRFFELIKHSVVFEDNQSCITKKLLRYPFCTIPK